MSSEDKDLNNTPGWHYTPRKREKYWVSETQATRHFWYQMLMGDATDNIKGVPKVSKTMQLKYGLSAAALKGVGAGTAKTLMRQTSAVADPESFVYTIYMEYGDWVGMSEDEIREYLLEQGQLLWMTRELHENGDPVLFQIDEEKYERARRSLTGVGDTGGREGASESASGGSPDGSENIV